MTLFVIAGPLTIPIWLWLSKKWGVKKMFIIGMLIEAIGVLPLLWLGDFTSTIIVFFILGLGLGCQGIMQLPIISDTIEEAASVTGTRNEGIYTGIWAFFGRLSIAFQVIIVGTVQLVTGFVPQASSQSPEALFGLHILMSIIPMAILTFGTIIFWILYDITPEKRTQIQEKLKELGI